MLRAGHMQSIVAQRVKKDDILIRDGTVFRILSTEWPYSIIRIFDAGQFGPRQVMKLEGSYHVPSDDFMQEIGVFESKLMQVEDQLECVLSLRDLLENPNQKNGSLEITADPDEVLASNFMVIDPQ